MKLDNETKAWLDDLARQGCNQRDVAIQLMQRLNVCIETDPPIYPSGGVLTYERAVNLYKSARKRVRKSSTDMLIAKTQIQCEDDDQIYVAGPTSVSSKPNGDPVGILIPTEAWTMPQMNLERPEQAPEAATPSQATPSPSAALPEPPVKDLPASFHELFPGLNPSAAPPLSKYVSEVISNSEQEISTEKTQAPQVKNYRHALCDYIDSVAAGGKRDSVIEESYADDAHLVDQLVSLLGPEIESKWDSGSIEHNQVVNLFKSRLALGNDLIVGRDGKPTTDPNNDRYDRIYEAQLGMYNGIRDLTDAVRALPIASAIAAKDETIAAKDAELETLREYVRHLQRQIGAA